jgi:hypothetical protein
VLICVASLVLQSSISLNIYNQSKDINLTAPIYFIYGGKWHVIPGRRIDVNTVMRCRFEIDSGQDTLEGILAYKIQMRHAKSGELIQDESRRIWLLVAWYAEYANGFHVRALLVEDNRELDKSKLRQLHQRHWHLLNTQVDSDRNDWQLNDTTALVTKIKVMNGGADGIFSSLEEQNMQSKNHCGLTREGEY